ncbi:transporter substrate-binding domain-containing protein [Orbaceae bacterium ESL0721]|nr:transporter substrate-binding domain-containing protein [Orbaceae bacterium ESL0721]
MNITKKILSTLLLTGSLAISSTASAADTLTFGTEATYAPFEFLNDKNEIVGFDVDIMHKICDEIKVTCNIVNQSFDGLIPSLKSRRIDAAIAGIDVTPERKKQVAFTQVYFDDSSVQFIVLKDGLTDLEQLMGKKVGYQNGTPYQKFLVERFPDATPVSYDSYQYAFLDLKAKRIDAIIASSLVTAQWLNTNSDVDTVGGKITDHEFFGEGLAIAVRQGNDKLLTQFNQALDKLKANGEFEAIYKKWFNK